MRCWAHPLPQSIIVLDKIVKIHHFRTLDIGQWYSDLISIYSGNNIQVGVRMAAPRSGISLSREPPRPPSVHESLLCKLWVRRLLCRELPWPGREPKSPRCSAAAGSHSWESGECGHWSYGLSARVVLIGRWNTPEDQPGCGQEDAGMRQTRCVWAWGSRYQCTRVVSAHVTAAWKGRGCKPGKPFANLVWTCPPRHTQIWPTSRKCSWGEVLEQTLWQADGPDIRRRWRKATPN